MSKSLQMIDLSGPVREKLIAKGISHEIADRISAGADLPSYGETEQFDCNFEQRETISMGFPVQRGDFTRMKDAAVTNMPAGELARMLDDEERIATFLDSGMRATPASLRLELPAWVLEKSRARQNAEAMNRARGLAESEEDRIAKGGDADPVLDTMGITEDISSDELPF